MRLYFGLLLIFLTSCSGADTNNDVTGKVFPKVKAKLLSGNFINIPKVNETGFHVLIIGYKQNSQFDIDPYNLFHNNILSHVLLYLQTNFPFL